MGQILDKLLLPFKTPAAAGELAYDSVSGNLQYYNGVTSLAVSLTPTVAGSAVPAAKAYVTSGTQSVTGASSAVVLFPSEEFDTDSIHSTSTNTSRLTCNTAGIYNVVGEITWGSAPTSSTLQILKNGLALSPDLSFDMGNTGKNQVSGMVNLAIGDYLELKAYTDTTTRTISSAHFEMAKVAPATGGARVTTLPASPVDGQEIYFVADATNNIVWHLRYNSTVTKWEFLGGPPLFAADVDTDETTASTTYVALTTAGPSITVPVAGDYEIELGTSHYQANPGAGNAFMSFSIGASTPLDADGVMLNIGTASGVITGSRKRRKTAIAASTAITAKYRVSSNLGHFQNRWMRIHPYRIG